MYQNQDLFDDDDDDDDDWEPLELPKFVEVTKWCCKNCTMVNLDDVVHCDICGEHQDSKILSHGFFASPFAEDEDTAEVQPNIKGLRGRVSLIINSKGCYFSRVSKQQGRSVQFTQLFLVFVDPYVDYCLKYYHFYMVVCGFSLWGGIKLQIYFSFILIFVDVDSQESAANSCTAIGFDERMLLHAEVEMKSHLHPERPDRLQAIAASLARAGIFPGRCYSISAREITEEELISVHSWEHIESVEVTSDSTSSYFTSDTYANEHSARAARLAAGICADLASTIVSGRAKNGFALVRPPGHHAGVSHAMGFCLHNNAAVAALAAQAAGARKVLILDWDVHHGNGTQEIFEKNKSVLYISLHRHEGGKFYPGTGAADEVGSMGAEGYCVNIPWGRGGVGDNDYIFAFQNVVLPIASEFAPDFTIISAGFDAARGDPLGCCDVTPSGYAKMTHMLNALSGGKLLVILEGGYNLRSISSSATAVIKVLLGESPGCELENGFPSNAGLQTVLEVLKVQMNYWPSLGPIFINLQSQWRPYCLGKKRKQIKKKRRVQAPMWWRWGRKSFLFHFLNGHLRVKSK
ncbi:histone deacetylase 15 isoform X2 [Gastrolobium bilobum]|nr:histone deacetylase 15 isoform X2 [Gastrolobium bilobum]